MVLASLKEALRLIGSRPAFWLPGVVIGCLAAVDLLMQYYGGSFLAGRLWVLEFLVLPFLFGGLLTAVKTGEAGLSGFASGGVKYYFRILLPGLVILFAVIVTIFLLALPLSLIGTTTAAAGVLAGTAIGVLVPFIFLTYFYDAMAVFEDTRVFESIRRSIELTIRNTGLVLKFFLVNIVILIAGFFILFMVWSAALLDRLTPLTTMNATEIQTITPESFTSLLGADGVMVTAVIFATGTIFLVTILFTYKACFFKVLAGTTPAPSGQVGDYDSKGRWYKY
jgi:hypothetical protein